MDQAPQPPHTHLFTVRLWLEELGDGQTEWRGQVQHVVSGEIQYFRNWQTLVTFLQEMLPKTGPVWQQFGSLSEPEQKEENREGRGGLGGV
jgi:hypothetical protein